jgi:hypothetical protein
MEGIMPEDEIEGMLAVQMVGAHNAAMECLKRAMFEFETADSSDQSLKQATKLLALYLRQVEVLDKRRSIGQVRVTVEYANVEAGRHGIVLEGGSGEPEPSRKSQGPAIEPAAEAPLETSVQEPATDKAPTAKARR